MPDWSYHTLFRPVLHRLPPRRARGLALGAMGRLARLPLGRHVIRFMGHMTPDPRLAVRHGDHTFPSPLALGGRFDDDLTATPGLLEFGFGLIEVGPIGSEHVRGGRITFDSQTETITCHPPNGMASIDEAVRVLSTLPPHNATVIARLTGGTTEQIATWKQHLDPYVGGFALPLEDASEEVLALFSESRLLLVVTETELADKGRFDRLAKLCASGSVWGTSLETAPDAEDVHTFSPRRLEGVREGVRTLRERVGDQPLIVAGTGVHTPADALSLLDAGANLVRIDSGLVTAGPGLPKRVNEAILSRTLEQTRSTAVPVTPSPPEPAGGSEAWWWAGLMGLAMLGGGLLAMIIACTRVVLPYDEAMSGLTREQLQDINPLLLDFMTHDRVTLSGTMIALGILYGSLAWNGIRHGSHWAHVSVVVSALAGFFSFFSFLGFGYFDPFHAFVTAVLFQFLLLCVHARRPVVDRLPPPDLFNTSEWRRRQWGQLLMIAHGIALVVAGGVIVTVGMTSVFVPEDLAFMNITREELCAAPSGLVPLVAHDRATFGGMLISCGVVTFLPSLWALHRPERWLWWTLLVAGTIAYVSTIAVHWTVGYNSLLHLLPAYAGVGSLWLAFLLGCPSRAVVRSRSG